MNSYHGNNRPYIYAVADGSEISADILNLLEQHNIALCLSEGFNSKEKRYIEAAYGVLFIINRKMTTDPVFLDIVKTAISCNKNILCIHEEEITYDPALSMQLDSQQAIFAWQFEDQEKLHEQILKAVIFNDMQITKQQKDNQKKRVLFTSIGIIAAVVLLFVFVILPLLKTPEPADEYDPLEQFGLAGLSEEDLAKITSLHVVGNKIFADPEKINKISTNENDSGMIHYEVEVIDENGKWSWGENGETERGSIEDISVLTKMPNLERLSIAGENITDISPLFSLEKLHELVINDNPISSLEGIENLRSLNRIELRGTLVSDLTPLYQLPSLQGIWVGNCRNITDISGFENTDMNALEIYGTGLREIKHLPKHSGFGLSIYQPDISDYSFLEDPIDYSWMFLEADIDLIKPHLNKMTINSMLNYRGNIRSIDEFAGITVKNELHLDSCDELYTLEGFKDIFPEVKRLEIMNCPNLNDLSPLLDSNVKQLIIDEKLADLISEEFAAKGFEVEIN